MIAWTTTPWTLPSNVALCVHPDLDYVKIKGLQRCETVKVLCVVNVNRHIRTYIHTFLMCTIVEHKCPMHMQSLSGKGTVHVNAV